MSREGTTGQSDYERQLEEIYDWPNPFSNSRYKIDGN